MEWQIILVLALVAPLLLFPVIFIWYVNIGGFVIMLREWYRARAAAKDPTRVVVYRRKVGPKTAESKA